MRLCRVLLPLALLWLFWVPLPTAAATSISPWSWEAMQGLVQLSDVLFTGQVTAVSPGDPSQPASPSRATVRVDEVHVGDPSLRGRSITVQHSAGDSPLRVAAGPQLFFVGGQGAEYRLAFFHTYGALPIADGKLAIWLAGKPHGQFYPLADVLTRLRRFAGPKVSWSATVPRQAKLAGGGISIAFVARNTGKESMRLLLPPHYFDAVWAYRLGPDGQRASNDWTGVSHWEHLKSIEGPQTLPAGGELRRNYVIPLAALGITGKGTYRVGVRLESHRRSERGERAVRGGDLSRFWLGGLDHFFVDVTVD